LICRRSRRPRLICRRSTLPRCPTLRRRRSARAPSPLAALQPSLVVLRSARPSPARSQTLICRRGRGPEGHEAEGRGPEG